MMKMHRITKNEKKAKEIIGINTFKIDEAIKVLKEASFEKFDSTLSISIDLNIDTKQADQQIRGSIMLPNGTGKDVKVLAIVDDADKALATSAGADYVEGLEILQKIKTNN
jgi:large subunit ribosomal protein L1